MFISVILRYWGHRWVVEEECEMEAAFGLWVGSHFFVVVAALLVRVGFLPKVKPGPRFRNLLEQVSTATGFSRRRITTTPSLGASPLPAIAIWMGKIQTLQSQDIGTPGRP